MRIVEKFKAARAAAKTFIQHPMECMYVAALLLVVLPYLKRIEEGSKMKKYIINPVTGRRYEIRNSSSRVGRKPPPKGLWSQEKQDSTQNKT